MICLFPWAVRSSSWDVVRSVVYLCRPATLVEAFLWFTASVVAMRIGLHLITRGRGVGEKEGVDGGLSSRRPAS